MERTGRTARTQPACWFAVTLVLFCFLVRKKNRKIGEDPLEWETIRILKSPPSGSAGTGKRPAIDRRRWPVAKSTTVQRAGSLCRNPVNNPTIRRKKRHNETLRKPDSKRKSSVLSREQRKKKKLEKSSRKPGKILGKEKGTRRR